jgi:RHS repeat-associated protein
MVYDGDGNRAAKNGTQYLVDDANPTGLPQVVEEIAGGAVQRTYTYGLQRISETQAGATTYYGYDGHGDVRFLMDGTGTVTDSYDYDAFGNIVGSTGTTPNVYRYQGEALDSETGLYYLRARYYDPAVGRFLSVDPLTDQGERPYAYAGADPVNGHDPTGQQDMLTVSMLTAAVVLPSVPQILGAAEHIRCIWSITKSRLAAAFGILQTAGACQVGSAGGGGDGGGPGMPPVPGPPYPSGPNKPQCNCTYHVRAHHLECRAYEWWGPVGEPFETFNARSGNNNNRPGVGPLPEGDYRMGSDVVQRGAVRIPLSFLDTQNYGRGGFQIHRDWPVPDRTIGTPYKPASEGCIATSDFGGLESFFAGMSCTRGTVSVLP